MNDVTNRCPEVVLLKPPLLPSQQVVAPCCAALCRELNLLKDPNHTPARMWNMTWSSGSSTDNDLPCILPYQKGFFLDQTLFSRDRRHLSKDGYAIWLQLILSCHLLNKCLYHNSGPYEDDFCDINRCYNISHSTKGFFKALHTSKTKYETNTAIPNSYNTYIRLKKHCC